MKKLTGLLLSAILFLSVTGCTSENPSEETTTAQTESTSLTTASEKTTEEATAEAKEITVFAAASLTETLNAIKEKYEAENPGITLVFNFDSSGTLKTQVEEGAEPDIFISAAAKQVDGLEEGGYIIDGTRKNILKNTVVLIVPEASDKCIASFEDCATDKVSLIALGNSDVPVGQYSEEIFTYLNIWDSVLAKASLGSTVKEVLAQVENASVDCGIVYLTDAASGTGIKVVCAAPEGSHSPVIYPAAIVTTTKDKAAAQDFLDYLSSEEAMIIFESAGFSPAE
jgi:molybdate transport system substrate-binding protein